MKNRFSILLFVLALSSFSLTKAANHIITVTGNYPNFSFSPSSLNVTVGDSVTWQQDFSEHPLAALTFPSGADSFYYNGSNGSFTYVVAVPGTYTFECTVHLFQGQFTASSVTGIKTVGAANIPISIYPTITNNSLVVNVAYPNNTKMSIDIYNVLGNKVASIDYLQGSATKLDVTNFENGIYFVAVKEEGNLLSVQKIIKQ